MIKDVKMVVGFPNDTLGRVCSHSPVWKETKSLFHRETKVFVFVCLEVPLANLSSDMVVEVRVLLLCSLYLIIY